MADDSRKSKVTDEHRAESAALLGIWNRVRRERRDAGLPVLSQDEFGQQFDIGNQAAVWQFLHGRVSLSAKAARGFAKGLGVKISDFSSRLADFGEAIDAASSPPAETTLADAELALRLANAFAALPAQLPDGTTKNALYNELMGLMRDRQRARRDEPHPRPEPNATPPAGPRKRLAQVRDA